MSLSSNWSKITSILAWLELKVCTLKYLHAVEHLIRVGHTAILSYSFAFVQTSIYKQLILKFANWVVNPVRLGQNCVLFGFVISWHSSSTIIVEVLYLAELSALEVHQTCWVLESLSWLWIIFAAQIVQNDKLSIVGGSFALDRAESVRFCVSDHMLGVLLENGPIYLLKAIFLRLWIELNSRHFISIVVQVVPALSEIWL